MRRQRNIASLVYQHLYPHPGPQDPPDFSQFLIRHLITEVRIETQRFYGGLDTIEAKYPGLNYSHPPHRKRLSRFSNHARLFTAFDDLGLTAHEISELCKWEGTLWARQRYERDERIKVTDTTANEIRRYEEKRPELLNRKSPRVWSRSPSRSRRGRDHVNASMDCHRAHLRLCQLPLPESMGRSLLVAPPSPPPLSSVYRTLPTFQASQSSCPQIPIASSTCQSLHTPEQFLPISPSASVLDAEIPMSDESDQAFPATPRLVRDISSSPESSCEDEPELDIMDYQPCINGCMAEGNNGSPSSLEAMMSQPNHKEELETPSIFGGRAHPARYV